MNLEQLYSILERLGIDRETAMPRGEHQLQIGCPLAPWFHTKDKDTKPSLSILYNVPGEWTVFKCFACGEKGRLADLVESYGTLSKNPKVITLAERLRDHDKPTLSSVISSMREGIDDWVFLHDKEDSFTLSEEAIDRFVPVFFSERAQEYLKKRRIARHQIEKFDLRYDSHRDRIVFPVRDNACRLLGAVGRNLENNPNQGKYYNYFGIKTNKCLGGVNLLPDEITRVIIVEGFFCLIRAYFWASVRGTGVVCTWKADMGQKQGEMIALMDKPVQIWYDNDVAGNKGASDAITLLKSNGVSVSRAKLPDGKDVDTLTEGEFVTILESTKGELWASMMDLGEKY